MTARRNFPQPDQSLLIRSPLALRARCRIAHFSEFCIGCCRGRSCLCPRREGSSSTAEAGDIVRERRIIRSRGNELPSTRKQRSGHFYECSNKRIRPPECVVVNNNSSRDTNEKPPVKLHVSFKLKSASTFSPTALNNATFVRSLMQHAWSPNAANSRMRIRRC